MQELNAADGQRGLRRYIATQSGSLRPHQSEAYMKFGFIIPAVLIAVHTAGAVQPSPEFSAGLSYFEAAEFGKAAVRFGVECNADRNAEACYWTGIAYERLADIRIPFGCRTAAKAHTFLAKAVNLAPHEPAYRDALFNFLLDDTDCSRAALPEAAGILSQVPQSDSEHDLMRTRLEAAAQWNSSFTVRLASIFLAVPRASYRISASSGALLAKRRTVSDSPGSPRSLRSDGDSQIQPSPSFGLRQSVVSALNDGEKSPRNFTAGCVPRNNA